MNVLLDTCALVWAVSQPEAMSKRARDIVSAENTNVCVSPISCAEIACAADRGRIALDRHWKLWFRHFVELNEWQTIDIDLAVMEEAYSLPEPFHRDPADRILVATARVLACPLLTADQKLLTYPHVETVW